MRKLGRKDQKRQNRKFRGIFVIFPNLTIFPRNFQKPLKICFMDCYEANLQFKSLEQF